MRKYLLVVFLLLSPFAFSQNTATVSGTLTNVSSAGVGTNAYLKADLYGCGGNRAIWSGGVVTAPFTFTTDANGNISGSIVRNDKITCGNDVGNATSYFMQPFINGSPAGPRLQFRVTSSTFNWNTATPITVQPVVPAPTGDSVYARLDGGNQPFSGNVQVLGAFIAGNSIAPLDNGAIVVDGCSALNPPLAPKYPCTAAGLASAVAAAPSAGGEVYIPATGSGCVAMGSNTLFVPSFITVRGAGMTATTLCYTGTAPAGGAIQLSAGTNRATVKDLQINFNAGASPNGIGITILGNVSGAGISQFNTFQNIFMSYNGLNNPGSIGIFNQGTNSTLDISLNLFQNILISQAQQMVRCTLCEGNRWDWVDGVNIGGTGNGQILWYENQVGDEQITASRIESGSGNGSNDICFQDAATSLNNYFQFVCDTNNPSSAINDLGVRNLFIVSLIGGATQTNTIASSSTALIFPVSGSPTLAHGGPITGTAVNTASNCSSSASPAVCSSAPDGSVVIAAAASTVVVNTTAVTANSQILITFDESLGARLGVTCNSAAASEGATYFISARSAGSSFTIKTNTAPTTNPACLSYSIVN